jgi:hypothetical protein
MDDRDQFFGEISVWLVLGPFVLALCLFGATLAALAGRFLVDVVASGGRLPSSVGTSEK